MHKPSPLYFIYSNTTFIQPDSESFIPSSTHSVMHPGALL